MVEKIGIVGGGNMCEKMLSGIMRAHPNATIVICTPNPEKRSDLAKLKNVKVVSENSEAAFADIIFLAVKPDKVKEVSESMREAILRSKKKSCIVSVVAGVSIETLKNFFGDKVQIVRAMPNIGAELGGPPIPVCYAENVSFENQQKVFDIFSNMGRVKLVPLKKEEMFHWYTVEYGCMLGRIADFVNATAEHAAKVLDCPKEKAEEEVVGFLEIYLKLLKKNPGMSSQKILETVRTRGGITDIFVKSLNLFRQTVEAGEKAHGHSVALGKKVEESALALEEAPKPEEVEHPSEKPVKKSVSKVKQPGGIVFHPKSSSFCVSSSDQAPRGASFFSTFAGLKKEVVENPLDKPLKRALAVSVSPDAGVFFGKEMPSNLNPHMSKIKPPKLQEGVVRKLLKSGLKVR